MRDIFVSGLKFTWSNKQKDPTLIKLDRILVSDSWESNFPSCFAWAKARIGTDHCPLILNSGEQGFSRPSYFSFNEQWLVEEGFDGLVQGKWQNFKSSFALHSYSLDNWHGCLGSLRKFLKG